MPATTDNRTRGVTVKVLDMTALHDQWSTEAHKHNPEITALTSAWDWAVGTDPSGKLYLICSEGVFWDLPPERAGTLRPVGYPAPAEIELYNHSDPEKIAMMPVAVAEVAMEDLKDLPYAEVDLADFVRSFGRRLETNFWNAHAVLTGKED